MRVSKFHTPPPPHDPRFKSLVGLVFGRLRVVSYAGKSCGRRSKWNCICDCGAMATVDGGHIKRGAVVSCGCRHEQVVSEGLGNLKHGMRRTSEYGIWLGIKDRVLNPRHRKFADYGGRGIGISDDWRDDFMAFYRDMGPRPSPRHEVEREDNDLGYSKSNCVWATRKTQTRNRRNNVYVVWNGRRMCLAECAELLGIGYDALHDKVRSRGMDIETAVKLSKAA